jgi:RimJ/RimL family protein N-acetyltransferase
VTTIPTLTAERFVLRGFRESDVHDVAALHGDDEVVHFLSSTGKGDPSLRAAWEYIASQLGHWSMRGYGKWALADRATDKLIGRVGYFDMPYEWPGCELGWTIAREIWGKGYASESARLALDWAFETLDKDEIVSMIHPDNKRSIAVAERLGQKVVRTFDLNVKLHLIYGISRDEWKKARAART